MINALELFNVLKEYNYEQYDVLEILKEIAGLNFIAVSKDYDAIYLTDKGQWKTRNTYPNTLYGWDCETLLVLNYDSIDEESFEILEER